jgi:hypothetical protein
MANYRSVSADAINNLLDSLPRLITQYNISQNELEFRRDQLDANKEANMFEAVLENNARKIELEERKIVNYEENVQKVEDEVSLIIGALPKYGTDPNATAAGTNIPNKILEEFTGNQKVILEESYNQINELVGLRNEAKTKFNFYDDIRHNLNDLANQSNKVHGNQQGSRGIADILDPQDFAAYFDNILTDDGDPNTAPIAGQYEKDDPMYGMYRRSFMNLAPSYEQVTKNALDMYKLDETIAAQNQDKIEAFGTSSTKFIALSIDSLYDVDEDTEALTEISDVTKESASWQNVVSEIRTQYGLDPDGAEDYINRLFMDMKAAYIQDPIQATDLMLSNPDLVMIMEQIAPIPFSLFENQFNDLMSEGLVASRKAIIPASPTSSGGTATSKPSKASQLLNKINSGI